MKQCLNCKHLEKLDLGFYVSVCICNINNQIVPPYNKPCEKYEREEQK